MNEFIIDVRDFDAFLLPENSRVPGTKEFQNAVINWFAERAGELGASAIVGVDDEKIVVQWFRESTLPDPQELAIELLQQGKLRQGADILQALVTLEPNDSSIRFNLGMALSDLGLLGDASKHLEKSVALEPKFSHAWVALGVAQQRLGDTQAAKDSFEMALSVSPDDGYAHRNLGVALMTLGETREAGKHFRAAAQLLPGDLQAAYANALWMIDNDEKKLDEADDLLIGIIESAPSGHPIVELAKEARSKIAMQNLRSVGGGIRMDAVMYLVGAIEKLRGMPREAVQAIGFEVAMLGQSGLDVNESAQKYSMRSIPGKFSGLHLMCYMYAAFKILEPSLDIGFDLSKEYVSALSLVRDPTG